MNKAILVNADIHEGTEGHDVGDHAGQGHSRFEVPNFFNAVLKSDIFKLRSWVTAGFGQLLQDIIKGGQPHGFAHIFFLGNSFPDAFIFHEILYGALKIAGHEFHDGIAFGVNGATIKGVFSAADAQKSRCLFEGFGAQARHIHERFSRDKGSIFLAVADNIFCQLGPQSRYICEQFSTGGVDLNTHPVDAAFDHMVKTHS